MVRFDVKRRTIIVAGRNYYIIACPRCFKGSMCVSQDKSNHTFLECVACSHVVEPKKFGIQAEESA